MESFDTKSARNYSFPWLANRHSFNYAPASLFGRGFDLQGTFVAPRDCVKSVVRGGGDLAGPVNFLGDGPLGLSANA